MVVNFNYCDCFSFTNNILYFYETDFNRPKTDLSKDLTGYLIIVTGSSAGIGKITAFKLLKKGATVIFACRNQSKTNEVLNTLPEKLRQKAIFMKLDLSSLTSVENFVKEFTETYEKLDILINMLVKLTKI